MDWRSINFDWNRARAFLVTAEEGSLSAAARALNMTQPTLGRQVSALEAELGIALFERTASGLVLTASGLELVEHVRAMGNAANGLSLAASGRSQAVEGSVCISATEATAAYVLPPIIAKLRAHAPGIEIEIVASNDSSDLLRREADIAIRAYRPTQPDLIAKKIRDTKAHLYATPEFLAQIPKRDEPADLSNTDFLGFRKGDEMIRELHRRGFDVKVENFPVYVESHLVQWELVKQGLGLGFMSESVGDTEPLVERALQKHEGFDFEVWLVVHRELNTSRRLRLVYDFLAEELKN